MSGPYTAATEEYDGSTWTSNPTGLNTVRAGNAGAGTQTAALTFGGDLPGLTAATEEYDGTNWTTVASLGTAKYLMGGAGTTAAALAFGGGTPSPTAATEEWTGAGSPLTKTITVS
jgi:hypothetical protein